MKLSTWFSTLVVTAIVLAGESGWPRFRLRSASMPGSCRASLAAPPTCACSRAFHLPHPPWVRCDGGRRSPLGAGLAFARRTSSAHGACSRAAGPAGAAARRPPRHRMSEDCLYLNVWTEAASASERRPVIVWSHGGALTVGTGSQTRWRSVGSKGRGSGHLQLPPRPVRLFLAPRVDQRIGAERVGQLRSDGSGGRAALGAAEHHCVWWRPEPCHA